MENLKQMNDGDLAFFRNFLNNVRNMPEDDDASPGPEVIDLSLPSPEPRADVLGNMMRREHISDEALAAVYTAATSNPELNSLIDEFLVEEERSEAISEGETLPATPTDDDAPASPDAVGSYVPPTIEEMEEFWRPFEVADSAEDILLIESERSPRVWGPTIPQRRTTSIPAHMKPIARCGTEPKLPARAVAEAQSFEEIERLHTKHWAELAQWAKEKRDQRMQSVDSPVVETALPVIDRSTLVNDGTLSRIELRQALDGCFTVSRVGGTGVTLIPFEPERYLVVKIDAGRLIPKYRWDTAILSVSINLGWEVVTPMPSFLPSPVQENAKVLPSWRKHENSGLSSVEIIFRLFHPDWSHVGGREAQEEGLRGLIERYLDLRDYYGRASFNITARLDGQEYDETQADVPAVSDLSLPITSVEILPVKPSFWGGISAWWKRVTRRR